MTDAADILLRRVADGDQSAFEELALQYAPLIESMSAQFAPSFAAMAEGAAIGEQDLQQEARLALYRAANTFDPEKKGITFGLYAKICIRNSLVSLWRKSSAGARVSRRGSKEVVETGGRDALSELLSASETGALREKIRAALSPYENRIFEQYISGMSVKQIALHVDKTEKSVSNALYRIRVKIKGLLSSD
ncbi:MAG: sigma-70 family RNA polymerase sigma factor [Clostridia bacterium]|nr:sigma-70 family RNA polymerase sigma factor [Clostridia bacterium]